MKRIVLRENLIGLLNGGNAHITVERAISGIKPENRSIRPNDDIHSIWEELEHLRIVQEDILKYTVDPEWKSPEWPEGYWPDGNLELNNKMWEKTVNGFLFDLKQVKSLVMNDEIDLFSLIPHASRHTYLREVLLVADHNTYHLGKIVQTRKMLGDWSV